MRQRISDRFIGLISAAVVALVSFWFGSFASDKDIQLLRTDLSRVERASAKKEEVTSIKTGIKLLASGLCIIDKKTCGLKRDIEKEFK